MGIFVIASVKAMSPDKEGKDVAMHLVLQVTEVTEKEPVRIVIDGVGDLEVHVLSKKKVELLFTQPLTWGSVIKFPRLAECTDRKDFTSIGLLINQPEEEIIVVRDSKGRTVSVTKTENPPEYFPITTAVDD